MALAIDATVGGADANSYVTLADALTLAENVWPLAEAEDFADADEEDQIGALVRAAQILDGFAWKGEPTDTDQAMQLPRERLPKTGGGCVYFDTDVIPDQVKQAQVTLACWLIKQIEAGTANPSDPSASDGLESIGFGSELTMTFTRGATSVTPLDAFVAKTIRPLVVRWIYAPGFKTVRG